MGPEGLRGLRRPHVGVDGLLMALGALEVERRAAGVTTPRRRAVLQQVVGDAAVTFAASRSPLRLVGDLADQLVPEADRRVARIVQQTGADQGLEPIVEHVITQVGDLAQEAAVDVAPDRRRHLRERQVDAGHREAR